MDLGSHVHCEYIAFFKVNRHVSCDGHIIFIKHDVHLAPWQVMNVCNSPWFVLKITSIPTAGKVSVVFRAYFNGNVIRECVLQ
jgi:hypothetical protein